MGNTESTETYESAELPSMEQWARLYDAAVVVKKQTPWKLLCDTNIVILELPGRSEPVFCSVMGRESDCIGVAVYPGNKSMRMLIDLLNSYDSKIFNPYTFEQSNLLCYFGNREDVEPRDRNVMKELGIRFRGKNQWIYFRSVKPGLLPWYLNATEAELLATALEGLAATYKAYLKMEFDLETSRDDTLFSRLSEETGEWETKTQPMPVIPENYENWALHKELVLTHLREKRQLALEVEMDTFFIPTPVRGETGTPALVPRLSLILDRERHLLLEHDVQTGPSSPAAILNCFVNFIYKKGRPTSIYVRNRKIAHILRNACENVNIQLYESKGMPATDDFIGSMMSYM